MLRGSRHPRADCQQPSLFFLQGVKKGTYFIVKSSALADIIEVCSAPEGLVAAGGLIRSKLPALRYEGLQLSKPLLLPRIVRG